MLPKVNAVAHINLFRFVCVTPTNVIYGCPTANPLHFSIHLNVQSRQNLRC